MQNNSYTKDEHLERPSSKNVNFFFHRTASYREVQKDIFGSIAKGFSSPPTMSTWFPSRKKKNLSLFIRKPADILMSHGVADKHYLGIRDQDKKRMIENFRSVIVPGDWLKNKLYRLKDLDLSNTDILVGGWPRLDTHRENETFKNYKRLNGPKPKVLWAPTHDFRKVAGNETASSYPGFEKHIAELSEFCDVSTSIHPRNRTNKTPTTDLLLDCDYVITDFGTMVYEAWALGKPVIFPRWILKDNVQNGLKGSAEAYIFNNNIGIHANSMEDLIKAITSEQGIDANVDDFMYEYLFNYKDGNSALKIASLIS